MLIKSIWKSAPALLPTLLLCLGIFLGFWVVKELSTAFFLFSGAFCLGWTLFVIIKFKKPVLAVTPAALVLGLFLGFSSVPNTLPPGLEENKVLLTGTIEDVTRTPQTVRIQLNAKEYTVLKDSVTQKTDFKVLCILHTLDERLMPGAEMSIKGKLHDSKQNIDIPYQTDYSRFLFIPGIVGKINIYDTDNYWIKDSKTSSFQRFIEDMRRKWLAAIVDCGFDESTTNFLLAVIGGENLLLDENLEENFRQAGLSHLLAISGLHVAIILALLTVILYPLKLIRRLRTPYFIILGVLVVFYALVTGGSPSACRAAAMCCVLLGNRIFEVRANPIQSLSVAVSALLCIEPTWLFMPGFQFSVCAVLGIIAFLPVFELIPSRLKWLRNLCSILIIPVAAVTGTLVLSLYYFHGFSFNFWLANIAASILVPIVISVGFVATLFSLVGLFSGLLVMIGNGVFSVIEKMATAITGFIPGAYVSFFPDTAHLILIALTIAIAVFLVWNYNHLRACAALVFVAALWLLVPEEAESLPLSEVYVPCHFDNTDVLVVHDGKGYLWTTAPDSLRIEEARKSAAKKYADFFKHRHIGPMPEILDDDLDMVGLSFRKNILEIGKKKIIRIDSLSDIQDSVHVDIALISNKFDKNMADIIGMVKADTILLSSAIYFSRHEKFVRQLDTLNVNFRSIRQRGFVWQFD